MSSKSPADRVPGPPLRSTTNSRSGSGNESGRNKTALTTLKMAVFAPMPSASVSTATAVKPGFFSNWRMANLRSFTQRLHRIHARGTARGQPAGEQRHEPEQQWCGEIGRQVGRLDVEQKCFHQLRGTKGT